MWKIFFRLLRSATLYPASLVFLFVFPASTNYQLRDFGFGTGGEEDMTSSNYAIDGISGEQSSGSLASGSYSLGPGMIMTQQANVPPAPAFTNPSSYYNKLKIVLDTGNNPSDTKFAIAVSTDSFSTTNYIQNDNTIGSVLGPEDYQTYTAWGGASGFNVIGLASSTTYQIKVKAIQGKFTETGYGPIATAATVAPTLSFDIDVSATDSDTNPPFTTVFSSLVAGTVFDSPEKIWVDFATNGDFGGRVYIYGQNGGLLSTEKSATIASVSGDLASLSSGFGAQGSTVAQGSGGPLTIASPYNGSSQVVGIIDTSIRDIFTTAAPIASGRGSLTLKAKSNVVTPASADYTERITMIASGNF
jgi:hypothetical protein